MVKDAFLEKTTPYESLADLVGKNVEVIIGRTLLLNWLPGVLNMIKAYIIYVRRQTPDGTTRYQIKRKSDCKEFPWLGDGIWFEGRYLGQVL